MAISPFMLERFINEGATGSHYNIPAYNFATDDLNECTSTMNTVVMIEAADVHEIIVGTDELLVEAATTNPHCIQALQEASFKSIKDSIIKFFKKIIEMIKGIIAKLKAYFYQITGKTSKWVTVMEPRINKARGNSGYENVSAERYKWNVEFVQNGIRDGIVKLMKTSADEVNSPDVIDVEFSNLSKEIKSAVSHYKDDDTNSVKAKAFVDECKTECEDLKKEMEKFKDGFPTLVAQAFGVSGTSLDTIWKEVSKKARGNANEKTDVKYGSEALSMLDVVKKSSENINKIKDAYDGHLEIITKIKDKLENNRDFELDNESEYKSSEVIIAAKEVYKVTCDGVVSIVSAFETAINTARQLNLNLHKEMISEYMTLLTKFASFKGTKK